MKSLVRKTFGKLTVEEYLGFRSYKNKYSKKRYHWYRCLCDCGNYIITNQKLLETEIVDCCKICLKKNMSYGNPIYKYNQKKRRKVGEENVAKILNDMNVEYEREKMFPDCKYIGYLRFDFYLPNQNICIEYNEIHHYQDDKYTNKRDEIKRRYCRKNGINIQITKY